ncbi:MAG: CAAX prenyl protease-related protein [Verrucomicrobiaceae bacterium]|nr:CAAX prenyl protease-related protein [Verrucomicrobiaceae bacterium]
MLKNLRESPVAAHIMPLAVFTAMLSVPGWFKIENPELPWHVRMPELWVYPAQMLLCAWLLLFFRKHYTLAPWRGLGMAVVFAVVGIGFWVLPAMLRGVLIERGFEPQGWWDWLGLAERVKGFDPTAGKETPWGFEATVAMRFARMVVIVPFAEELFWRGFLMRFLVDQDRPFQSIPFGTHRRHVFWIVTLAVITIHNTADWPGAFVWGALMYYLAVRTRSLGACVVMHAVGNLLLGVYVMKTGLWGFW